MNALDDLQGLVATFELAQARGLARAGRYTEADGALSLTRTHPAGLDLRARIAAQQGHYTEAAALWHEAAERRGDPDAYAAELASLARLESRRVGPVPLVAVVVALGAAFVAGVGWAGGDGSSSRPAGSTGSAGDGTAGELRGDVVDELDELLAEIRQADQAAPAAEPGPSPLEDRLRALAGTEVTRLGDVLQVRFTQPVFTLGVSLTSSGQTVLADVAAAVTPTADRQVVVVSGHTDAVPLPPGGRYADNQDLALARAEAAAARLVAGGVPSDRAAVSVATAPPPHPQDEGVAQPLNRTVELVIYEQGPPATGG